MSTALFAQQFYRALSAASISDRLRTYLNFHIIPGNIYGPNEVVQILPLENGGAVKDYYETLLAIIMMIMVADDSAYRQAIIACLRLISEQIQDPRISVLLFDLEAEYWPNAKIDELVTSPLPVTP